MRYKIICNHLFYYLAVLLHLVCATFCSFLGQSLFARNETGVGIFVFCFSGLFFLLTLLYVNRFLYGKIDTQTNTFIFGNLLSRNEVPLSSVRKIGHYLFYRNVLKIEINGKWFYINNLDRDVNDPFQHHSNTKND
jgi:hypothetical protein